MSNVIDIEPTEVTSKPLDSMSTSDLGALIRNRTMIKGDNGHERLIDVIDTIITRSIKGDMKAASILFERGWGKVPETYVQTISSDGTSKITIITPDGNQLLLD